MPGTPNEDDNNTPASNQSQQQTAANDDEGNPTPTPPTVSDPPTDPDKHAELLNKIRLEEKEKHRKRIEKLEKDKADASARLEQSNQKISSLESKIKALEKAGAETSDLIDELAQVREQNKKLDAALENLATESAKEIRSVEIRSYKEKKIAENKIMIPELVTGNTEDEIDASVKKAIARQKELGIGQQAGTPPADQPNNPPPANQAQPPNNQGQPPANGNGDQLPTPIAPHGSAVGDANLDVKTRQKLVRATDEEYANKRQLLLEKAKKDAGLA